MVRRFFQLSFLLAGLAVTSSHAASKAASRASSTATVIVDAGHGGHDRGGIPRQRVSEKAMTLDVAQRLRRNLEASGYRVIMTRNSDVFIPLGTRTAIANSYRNAIFVSVHFNSARRSGANGIETYFYSRDSHTLASAVHYNVARATSFPNRGVRRRGFFVLRRTRIPAVLVECGFLTNPSEARIIQSSAYRQKLADAIANGVRGRSNVVRSTLGSNVPAIPLQPFIDQTRVSRKRSAKRSRKRKSSKSKKKSSAAIGQVIGYYVAAGKTAVPITSEG